MPFNDAIPQPTDLLSNSQGALLANNGFLNTWSNVDHYALNDATGNNGKHQVIQLPSQGSIPSTTTDPKLFSYTPAGNAGVLTYLSGPSGAVQSPILPIQSTSSGISLAGGSNQILFDFGSSIYCFGSVNLAGYFSSGAYNGTIFQAFSTFFWNGSSGVVSSSGVWANQSAPNTFPAGIFQFSGNQLQFFNNRGLGNMNKISWTITINRMFTPL